MISFKLNAKNNLVILRLIQKTKNKKQNLLLVLFFAILLTGCNYGLKPGSTGSARTLSVKNFPNEGGGGPSSLGQTFTEKLRSYFQQNSRLTLIRDDNADWLMEGRIVKYAVSPIAPTSIAANPSGTSAQNRLTIRVEVTFNNKKYDESKGPQQSETAPFVNSGFEFFQDFPQTQSLSQVETQLIDVILDQIVLDIYTKTTSNW
ncbi:MAG TPA: LptE family protein [Cytophagaceae bacterium]|nr:LptE family protein [Cytophagaceae bacterium]